MNRKQQVQQATTFYDALLQDKWWKRRNQTLIKISDMAVDYKVNALGWLLRHSQGIAVSYGLKSIFLNAPDDVQASLDWNIDHAAEFVLATPCAQALLKGILDFAGIGPEVFGLVPLGFPVGDGVHTWILPA